MYDLRFAEGHNVPPKDSTEQILLEIWRAEYEWYYGDLKLSFDVWVSRNDKWFLACAIYCDDIIPVKGGGLYLMRKAGEIVSYFSSDTLLAISEGVNFDNLNRSLLFKGMDSIRREWIK